MSSQKQHGFTIIELMLFLGVTGALFAALMIGVNTNIGQQRYRESVIGLSSLIQQQYSEVANTRNERDGSLRCAASVVTTSPTNGQPRGTSDCVILGRYVQVKGSGRQIETGVIIGTEPPASTVLTGDTASLIAFNPKKSDQNTTTVDVDWQSTLKTTEQKISSSSLLILRSPVSGLVRTYGSIDELPANITDMLTDSAAKAQIKNCVVGEGALSGPIQSIIVDAGVAGPNGVTINGLNDDEANKC